MGKKHRFCSGSAFEKETLCLLILSLAALFAGSITFGRAPPAKAANASQGPAFDMMMQLNIYSIDLKTDTMYSSYYSFLMYSLQPEVQGFRVVVLRPDYYEGMGSTSWNVSGNQEVSEEISSDPAKGATPWQWHLNAIHPAFLGTPFDHYELSFLIAVNMSTTLQINSGTVHLPITLQGDWIWSSDIAAEKLSEAPSNQTLTSLGLSPQKFYLYGCNVMTDFYLFTVALHSPSMTIVRTTIAFYLPALAILVILCFAIWRLNNLKRADVLAIFVGAGLFTLSFLVSFFQYAPPDVFTWEEVLLIVDFAFAAGLAMYAVVRKDKAEPEEKATSQTQDRGEKQQEPGPRLVEIGVSLDKAFEWFVVLMSVLIGVLFAFLTWITKPETNLALTAKFMFSMTAPFILTICTWLWNLLTLSKERQIFLRIWSWSTISMIFAYYIMLFSTFVVLGISGQQALTAVLAILVGSAFVAFFPSRRIARAYNAAIPENDFWKRRYAVAGAYLLGASLAGILILMPFVFP
jgi:hypothetical protein